MTDAPIVAHGSIASDQPIVERQGFHLVDPSPWPIVGALFALLTAVGLILTMKDLTFLGGKTGPLVLALGIAGILFTMAGWWWDVIIEAQSGYHNALVRHGLTHRHDPVHRLGSDVLRRLVLGVFRLVARRERSANLRPAGVHRRAYGRRREPRSSIRSACP